MCDNQSLNNRLCFVFQFHPPNILRVGVQRESQTQSIYIDRVWNRHMCKKCVPLFDRFTNCRLSQSPRGSQ